MKDLSKHNLDLDNEVIRKKREERQQKEDTIKQQTKLDDLQSRVARAGHDSDDDVEDVRTELERKLRKIKNLRDMIRDLKAKIRSSNNERNNKAKRVVQDIESAIDQINIPNRPVRPVASKGISKTHIYSSQIIEEEHIPLWIRVEEIFEFVLKEYKKIMDQKKKAQLEYKLISGLKNNLHKENIGWKKHMSNSTFGARKSLMDINNKLEDQSTVLEGEKRDLISKIDQWAIKEKILCRI
jgi:hypothetical protein